jgi:hypothetical protein
VIGPAAPERTVRVKLLADPKLRQKDPRWRQTVAGLLEAASDYFENEFGVRFVAQGIEPWEPNEAYPSAADLLGRLKKDFASKNQREGSDVIIALTGEPLSSYSGGRGMAILGNCDRGLGNYLVSSVTAPFRYAGPRSELSLDAVALIHELGHIFGAEHVKDPNSIMHENFDYRFEFDLKSREIILKNKYCPFGK